MRRKNPGDLNMASPGAGTSNHLMSELLAKRNRCQVGDSSKAPARLIIGQFQFIRGFAFHQLRQANRWL